MAKAFTGYRLRNNSADIYTVSGVKNGDENCILKGRLQKMRIDGIYLGVCTLSYALKMALAGIAGDSGQVLPGI